MRDADCISREFTIPNYDEPAYYRNMRINLIIIWISMLIGVAYGAADFAAYKACRLLDKAVIFLCPELDYELKIRNMDENDVRILTQARGYVWEPMIGRTTDEILKKWNRPSSIEHSAGLRGSDGDWGAPIEIWHYVGYSLLFNQQHRCFYASRDGVYH